jgi:exodeoxyribonuclease VII large subunit
MLELQSFLSSPTQSMTAHIKLSDLLDELQETIQQRFEGEAYWVSAQITNVKKYEANRRCYLSLVEMKGSEKVAEVKAVFWSNSYAEIENFEHLSKQAFVNGLEIICKVRVRFHKVYGLNVDVIQIDIAHTLGSIELERQATIDRLLKENPQHISLYDGVYRTYNNRLPLPALVQQIALITAPGSDGQRDFKQEILNNKYGYAFAVHEFLCTIQGDQAHVLIQEQLTLIAASKIKFDAVAIVRGGGSQTDFKPFDNYELARLVAVFPIPVLTGIGHDRNQSIVDLMAREQKTPTKVAAVLVEHNFEFENKLIALKDAVQMLSERQIQQAAESLHRAKRLVKLSSPKTIMNRGFAIITQQSKIITNPEDLQEDIEIETQLKEEIIISRIEKKRKHEKSDDLY